ncbi:MAG: Holliday junction resolvase RuvX [Woeseiaceae bacterium]
MPDRNSPETIIAFDFGLRRIGIAVGQDVTGSANPLGTVQNGDDGPDFESIGALIEEWRPQRLIVGMPAHADGSESGLAPAILSFVRDLGRFELPVVTEDERYTSLEAAQALKNARQAGSRGRIGRDDIDAAAAVIIAERYLLRNL